MDWMSTEIVQKTVFDITSNKVRWTQFQLYLINRSYHLLTVCQTFGLNVLHTLDKFY